jgi:hypothetical protein
VGVAGHLEDLHFAHGRLLGMLLFVWLLEFLYRHEGVALDVAALQHHPVRALPDRR